MITFHSCAPKTPRIGDVYYDLNSHRVRIYTGSRWSDLAADLPSWRITGVAEMDAPYKWAVLLVATSPFVAIQGEIAVWCQEHCNGGHRLFEDMIRFEKKEDRMKFQLRFQ